MLTPALTEEVYYILITLHEAMNIHGVMQNVELLSNGRIHLESGMLNEILNSLLDKGWILAESGGNGGRKKKYKITTTGRQQLKVEVIRLKELWENGRQILEEDVLSESSETE